MLLVDESDALVLFVGFDGFRARSALDLLGSQRFHPLDLDGFLFDAVYEFGAILNSFPFLGGLQEIHSDRLDFDSFALGGSFETHLAAEVVESLQDIPFVAAPGSEFLVDGGGGAEGGKGVGSEARQVVVTVGGSAEGSLSQVVVPARY